MTYAGRSNQPVSVMAKYKCLAKVIRITAYVNRAVDTWKRLLTQRRARKAVNGTRAHDEGSEENQPPKIRRVAYAVHPYDITGFSLSRTQDEIRIREPIATVNPIDVEEYKTALRYWLKKTQLKHFKAEIAALRRGDPEGKIRKTKHINGVNAGRIDKLCPFLDSEGLIRAQGRLHRSSLTYDQRHPIIVPKDSLLAQRLIKEAHDRTLHGGTHACIQYVRDAYWVQGLRSMTRRHVRECLECAVRRKETATQLMADLPSTRVSVSTPFAHCGVDLAAPFKLTAFKGRGTKVALNAYIAVFVCFASRAVHLELLSDLTSATFLAGLDRMIARRPGVRHLYSDNGTNFVGAAREPREFFQAWSSSEVINELTLKNISWHFNTPLAPHHGGLWEAAVKSLKHHLSHYIENIALTFEELYMVAVRIEACLNSRPIAALNDDPTDLTMITPGHLATGGQIVIPMPPVPKRMPTSGRINWRTILSLQDDIWQRWQEEYLQTLQLRNKWTNKKPNVAVGDFVIINEPNLPPAQWRRGRIQEVLTGKDGLVRSVLIKTAAKIYQRPITRVCVLPTAPAEDEPEDNLVEEPLDPA